MLERSGHIGRLPANGLGATDITTHGATGGLFLEIVQRNARYYRETYGADSSNYRACRDGYHFEPSVAEKTFHQMLAEYSDRITVKLMRQFDAECSVRPPATSGTNTSHLTMVISDKYKSIYLGAPKTATTSLHRWLIENGWGWPCYRDCGEPAATVAGWLAHEGPQERQHHCVVWAWYRDYYTWTVWRDPIARGASLYRHYLLDAQYAPGAAFSDFIDLVTTRSAELNSFYWRTQADWWRGTRLDAIIPFHDLTHGLSTLACPLPSTPLPISNVSRPVVIDITPSLARPVRHWAAEDERLRPCSPAPDPQLSTLSLPP